MKDDKTLQERFYEASQEFLKNYKVEYFDDDVALVSGIELKRALTGLKTPRNMFYFCHNGVLNIETPEALYTVNAGETFFCPSGTHIRLKNLDPEIKFSALALTDRVLQSLLNTNIHLWNNIVYVMKERVISPARREDLEEERTIGWHYARLLDGLLKLKDRPFKKEMIYLTLQMGLLGFCALHNKDVSPSNNTNKLESGTSQAQIIFTKFMELLQNEPIKHQSVAYYADKLCVSSKYLSYVCKLISGKSASEFIQNAVIGEIMYYLENTTLSIKEISCRMGFSNISFFGKFVKSHLGVSPNKYRK